MSKAVVVEFPKGSGCYTKIMPGSQAMEYLEAVRKGDWGTKGKPGPAASFEPHMTALHKQFLKDMGVTQEQHVQAMERWNK